MTENREEKEGAPAKPDITSPPGGKTHEATSPPGQGELDKEAEEKSREGLDRAGGGH